MRKRGRRALGAAINRAFAWTPAWMAGCGGPATSDAEPVNRTAEPPNVAPSRPWAELGHGERRQAAPAPAE